MIPSDEIRVRELVRREMDARMRSPILNSQMSPRGVTQGRVAKRLVTNLPAVAQEFDEVNLEQSDGSVIPFLFKGGSWTPLGGNYVVYDGLYIPHGQFEKVTIAVAAGGALPIDSDFTKEFDDTILEIFMSGSGWRPGASGQGLIGMVLRINSTLVANITTFANVTDVHLSFVSRTYTHPSAELGTGSYAAGTYDLDIERYDANTSTDSNDTFYVTITEKFAATT